MDAWLKRIFISTFCGAVYLATLAALGMLLRDGFNLAWLGVLVAALPMTYFFSRLFLLKDVVRTSPRLWGYTAWMALGLALALAAVPTGGFALAQMAAAGLLLAQLLYVFWYSRFAQRDTATLAVGQPLPPFQMRSADGEIVNNQSVQGRPCLMVFYRGNWCPLCVAQIGEIAAQYRELEQRGAQVAFVSSQPPEHTQALAQRFDIPAGFWIDQDNQTAKSFGIFAQAGTPAGMEALGYSADTAMPTVVITNAQGVIVYADLTDNYRVRPEPAEFLRVLDELGVPSAA